MNNIPINYNQIVSELKERIRLSRLKAAVFATREFLQIYWHIGNIILEQQKIEGWGSKVIDRLASDLRAEFPDFKGLSLRNLKYMRAFAEA